LHGITSAHRILAGARKQAPIDRPEGVQRTLYVLICLATFLFALLTPPFQSPDESQHYLKAAQLAEGRILAEQRGRDVGAMLPASVVALHEVDFPAEEPGVLTRIDIGQIKRSWTADSKRSGEALGFFPNVANYAPTLYAPQAAGIALAQKIGLPRLGGFYLGRLFNVICALFLLGWAVRVIPVGRFALLAVAALPTTCYQAGSLSPDALINGLGFLGLALALRFASEGVSRSRSIGLGLVAMPLALAKGVYLPLMAAGLRWPEARRDARPWLLLTAMVLGAVVFMLWMKASGGSQTLYSIVSRKTGELTTTAPLADQLRGILADPVAYAHILSTSMVERAPVYLLQIVGRFGWNTILLPLAAYPLAAVMLAAAALSGAGDRFGFVQRLWWLLVTVGCVLLVETALYLTGTPLGADYVQGVQGRYFLPILPLALLAFSVAGPVRHARSLLLFCATMLLGAGLLSVLDSFWLHGFVSVDGMPPHRDAVRALLLPSPRW